MLIRRMLIRRSLPLLVATCALLAQKNAPDQKPNSQLNPYKTVENFFQPEGFKMGSTAGMDIDAHQHIWIAQRCGGNSCVGKSDDPIVELDTDGKMIKHFGGGMFVFPHGLGVDREGNVWVTDGQARDGKGMVAIKFSPDGKVLMKLGKDGVAGDGRQTDAFNQPNDVAVAPNGDIFVSEGHTSSTGSARVVKFDKNGKFLLQFGQHGSGPGEFEVPHALCFDSKGRLFVADRGNSRVQIFDQSGKFIAAWTQFGRPSGIFVDARDILYAADSESQEVKIRNSYGYNPGWIRGIRVGSAVTGVVTAFLPDPDSEHVMDARPITTAAEGVVADAKGAIYGAEVGRMDVKKYVK